MSALARLTRRQRQVLVLRYVADLSEEAAAGPLGCTVGAVKNPHPPGPRGDAALGPGRLRLELMMLGLPVDPHPPRPGTAEPDAVRKRGGAITRRRRGRRLIGGAVTLVLAVAAGSLALRPTGSTTTVVASGSGGAPATTAEADDRTAPLGEKVLLAQGESMGLPWSLTAYDSLEGLCAELSVEGGRGTTTTSRCGEVSGSLTAVVGDGPAHVGVHGGVDRNGTAVRVVLDDGSSVDAAPVSGGDRFPVNFFAVVLPVDSKPVEVVALDAGGRELARQALPSREEECLPLNLPSSEHEIFDC